MTIPQSHRLGPWYGHWRPMSKKWQKKNPLCETVVWPPTLKKPDPWDRGTILANWVKNLNTGVRCPSKLPVIDGGQTSALKLLPSGLPQIRWRGTEEGEFSFLMSDTDIKKKKLNLPPSIPRYRICDDAEGNNFKAGVRGPSIRESFDRQPTPVFGFLIRSGSDHTLVSRTGVF